MSFASLLDLPKFRRETRRFGVDRSLSHSTRRKPCREIASSLIVAPLLPGGLRRRRRARDAASVFRARAGQPGASQDHGNDRHPRERAPLRLLCRQAERHDGPGAHGVASSTPIRAEADQLRCSIDNGDFLQGNPMGDYIAYEQGMKDGDVHPVIKGDEHARLRMLDARQPRVQLRPRLPGQGAGRREFPVRLRQPDPSGTELAVESARRRALPQALRDRRQEDQGRLRRRASDQDRRHRLRAAADHDLGRQEPDRQGR